MFALQESVRNVLQNPHNITHLTLSRLLHYHEKLKIQIFCKYSADMEENETKLHFKKLLNFEIHLSTFCCVPLQMQTFYQNLVLVAKYHADC